MGHAAGGAGREGESHRLLETVGGTNLLISHLLHRRCATLISMPNLVVIAGPNGSGKSTTAPRLLRDTLKVDDFINADAIAGGLSAFAPERVAFPAGRIMLRRMHELAAAGADFALESTLSSRSLAPWIVRLKARNYVFHLIYLWLSSADLAVQRVAERVRQGGHDVPAATVRRRYSRSLGNFSVFTVRLRIPG